jgi:hypothetical protein
VVAAWQAGIGRVLCYTGEADGKHTGAIASWKDIGDYLTSLARWTAGQSGPLPDNILVTQEVRNGTNIVQLHLDPERKGEPFTGLPRVTTLRGVSGQKPVAQKAAMHWSSADTLTLETPLQGNETVLTTVEVPGQQPLMLSPVCLPYSPEFKPVQGDVGLMTLDHLARATGGKERVNLAGIWTELPKHPRMLPIGHWLVILAIMVLLLEILERRTGLLTQGGQLVWQATQRPTPRRGWRFWHRPSRTTEAIPTPQPAVAAPQTREPAQPAPAASGQPKAGMLDALHKARQRGRERTER